MDKREKVIKGLECCKREYADCDKCPYDDNFFCLGKDGLLSDALELLKAQEPRVMTIEEVTEDMPDVVWFDDRHFVMTFATIPKNENYHGWIKFVQRDGTERHNHIDGYGKEWRCWTSRPTDAQREAVKWDG